MSLRSSKRPGAVRVALTGAVAALSLTVALGASPARAAAKQATKSSKSSLPVVGNATKLSAEPIIHAGKGKPPTKLETKDLVVGTGAVVTSTSTVSVKYVGANYANGKVFTAGTWKADKATTFPLDEVVPGFAAGLVGMKVGGRREIVIPPKLGYGSAHTGPIVPNETLVFVVDLEGVSPS